MLLAAVCIRIYHLFPNLKSSKKAAGSWTGFALLVVRANSSRRPQNWSLSGMQGGLAPGDRFRDKRAMNELSRSSSVADAQQRGSCQDWL